MCKEYIYQRLVWVNTFHFVFSLSATPSRRCPLPRWTHKNKKANLNIVLQILKIHIVCMFKPHTLIYVTQLIFIINIFSI